MCRDKGTQSHFFWIEEREDQEIKKKNTDIINGTANNN